MCCCPLRYLKFLIYIACVLIIGVGAVLIWAGYQLQNSVFLELIELTYIGYIIIACGAALILVSFLGFIGTWKEKKLLEAIFIISVILITFVIISFGVTVISTKKIAKDYLGNESDCHNQFGDADDATQKVVEVLCTLYCPCLATNDYIKLYVADLTNSYSFIDQGAKNVLDCDPCIAIPEVNTTQQDEIIQWVKYNLNMDISTTDCSVTTSEYKNKYFTSDMRKYFPILKWVEENFKCSGLCYQRELYMFSDVNNGKPENSCTKEINDWAQSNSLAYGIISIIFGCYPILVWIMSCTVCCCPKKEKADGESKS
ncbi:hypothetical protein SteCoe_22276 [Stentor coeruleus]|uniref:Tetraspanin family protein n=1 Tax=Stentor coeruleus TaxID=5963 RepID=A0A1R2BN46_9CILI|nr:hypothetical protein SteCoe_22276 [Stentor coeruleus]